MTKSNIMKIRLVGFMAALLFISCVAEESKVEKKLKEVDPMNMTPMEALNLLYEIKKEIK